MQKHPGIFGGLEGDRTLDLCDANAALSQLSYEPLKGCDKYTLNGGNSQGRKGEKSFDEKCRKVFLARE